MSSVEGKGLVPELRFPEFRGDVEWQIKSLGNPSVAEFVSDKVRLEELDIESYVSTENLLPNFAGIRKASRLPPSGSFTEYKKYDVLVSNIRPYLKKVWYADKTGAASNDVIVIRSSNKLISSYLLFILKNDAFINYVMDGAKGVKMPRGDLASIQKYPVAIPGRKEQQKIADCLSSIDELISAQAEKIEALKTHKKGLMQKLFPAEGKTTPELRFPEFQNNGEWKETDLGSIGKVSMCKRILKSETAPVGDIPFYKIGTFGKQADAYISRDIFNKYKVSYSYPKIGDILISAAGTIGRLVVFDGQDAYFQDSNIVWIDNGERMVTNGFLYYCYGKVNWSTDGNTIARLYNDNLRRIKIIFPTLEEQQKIAACLSSIDELITAHNQKLALLKTHKKGLMQELFPTTEGITQ